MSQIDSLPDLTEFRPRPLPDLSAFMPPNPGILHNAAGAATSLAAASDPERPNRAARTDALVHAGRAATPQAVLDQRAVPRASIAELNQMDGDLLRQRFEQIRRDDRSPTEQVLDLIDLPRNTIANIMWGKPSAAGVAATVGASAAAGAGIGAFGGLAGAGVGGLSGAAIGLGAEGLAALGRQLGGRVNTEQSPTAALGQKQIFVSDALQKLGVENRVIRAILGFAGDVLIDPLTYVGPPGWGLRLTAQVGKGATEVLHLTGSAGRAIRSATTKLAAGAELGTDLERAAGAFALKEAGHTPETIAAAKAAGKSASEIAGELRAAVSGKSASGVIEKSFRPLGGELGYEGSGLVKRFHDPVVEAGDAADLAKRFVELGGRGSGRALRIGVKSGDVGSQVLHVPFGGLLWPEASVQVPAFSAAAKNAARARVVAMQRAIGVGNAFSHTPQAAAQVVDGSSKLNELAGEMRAATMEHPIRTREQDDLIDALRKRRPPEPPSAPSGPDMPKPPEPPPGPGPTVPPPGTPPTGGAGGAAHVAPYLPDQDTGQDLGKLLDDADAAAKAGETIPKPPTPPSERERVYAEAHAAFSNLPENEREANLILLRHAVEARAKQLNVQPEEIWKTISFKKGEGGKGGLYSIMASHGSPNLFGLDDAGNLVDPKAFSLKHIGKGEGAQYRGYGHYAADADAVAQHYRDLAMRQVLRDGETVPESQIENEIKAILAAGGDDHQRVDRVWRAIRGSLTDRTHYGVPGRSGLEEAKQWTTTDEYNDVLRVLNGLEHPPSETGTKIRSGKGVRAIRSLDSDGRMDLFDIESRMSWASGKTPEEKWSSVQDDLRQTIRTQEQNIESRISQATKWGHDPRELTATEQDDVIQDIIRTVRDSVGWPSDPAVDAFTQEQINQIAGVLQHYWRTNDLIANGRIGIDKIEQHIIDVMGGVDAGKVFDRPEWRSVQAKLEGPRHYASILEAREVANKAQRQLSLIDSLELKPVKETKPGAIYKLELAPDHHELLHLDKPMAEQSQHTQDAVRRIFDQMTEDMGAGWNDLGSGEYSLGFYSPHGLAIGARISPLQDGTFAVDMAGVRSAHGSPTFRTIEQAKHEGERLAAVVKDDIWSRATGLEAYKAISNELGARFGSLGSGKTEAGGRLAMGVGRNDKLASEALLAEGVRGNKFLDGFSRSAGTGNHNYVIFSDDDVTIRDVLRQLTHGSFSIENGQSVIRAIQSPNVSTMVHEMGHLFRTWLPPEDLSIVSRVYGVDPATWGKKLTANGLRRPAEERFAQDFERYMATGDLPAMPHLDAESQSVLRRAFETIKAAMVDLYKSIVGTPLEGQLSPELKGVFDRIIGGEGVKIGEAAKKGPKSFTPSAIKTRLARVAEEMDLHHGDVLHEHEAWAAGGDTLKRSGGENFMAEVRSRYGNDKHMLMQFKLDPKGDAESIASAIGWDEYFRRAEESIKGESGRALELGRSHQNPGVRFDAWMLDHARGAKPTMLLHNPGDLPVGTSFTIYGEPVHIVETADGKAIQPFSGKPFEIQKGALDAVPFDEGSIKLSRPGEEVPALSLGGDAGDDIPFSPGGALYQKSDIPGQTDIFGRNVGPSGEKQGGLFGDVSAPPKPTLSAAELAAKYPGIRPGETAADFERRMGTADTGMLFQGGSSELDAAIAERKAMDEAYTARIAALHEAMKAELDKMEAAVATIDPAAHNSPASINAALGLMQSVRQAQANSEHATAQYNLWKNLRGIAPTVATADPEHVVRQLTNLADGDDELLRVMDSLVHDNPEALSDLQAAAERSMEAAQKHEGILQQDVIALASKEEGILSELAKSFLGITDEHQARSLFAPIGSALQTWGAQRAADTAFGMDRWWRKTFNARGGLDQRIYADIAHNFNQGASETQYRWLQRIRQTVADQMPKGVTPEQLDKAHAIFFGHLYSAADPGGHSYRMWDFGDKATSTGPKLDEAGKIVNKSQLVRMMEEAQSDGLFANGIAANLKAEAQKIIDETTAMADREQSDLLIGQLLHGWVPRTLDPDTEESVRAVKEAFGTFTGSARIGPQRTQLPRSTWEIVFPDGDVWRRFIGADGFLKNMTPEQLAAYKAGRSPEQVALIDGTIENMKRWEALTDPQSDEFVEGFADKFRPMSTDHLEVNRDWANGRFTALTGGDTRPGAYFDRTPGAAIANRFSQHERMVSARRLIEALAPSAFEVDPIVIRNAMNATGETRTSKYGVNMTMLAPMASTYKGLGRQVPAVRVGKETYRMLADEARNAIDSSLANSLSRNIHGMLFHETVADRLERLIEVTADPEHAGTMLRAYDHILAAWKMATLFSPSWPVFNMAGNVFFMLAGGVRPDHVFKHAVDIARAVAARNNPERLNAIELEINGQRVTAASLLESATHRSVFNNNYTTDTAAAMHIFDNTIAARPEHYLRTYLAPWLRANQFLENHSRMLAYVSYLEQGMDEASAAQKAIDAMIDYSDLSRVEQKVFRRVLPFYSWVRGNAGRQVQLMLEQPKWANLTPKLKEAIETAAAGEDQVPYDQRPGWMKEAMATQIGSDPEGRLSVMLRDALPTGDIMQILAPIVGPEGVQQFLHFFGSSLTPVVGVPLQLGAGREYFSGRSIGKDAYSGDETYGEFLRGATLRPVGEAVKIGQRIGQGRYGEAAARVLLGGRVQAFDQERLQTSVAREVRDEETRIQSAIRRAERNGDHAASTEARARLLRLYEDAQRRGVKIPQWAAEQLGVLTSPAA